MENNMPCIGEDSYVLFVDEMIILQDKNIFNTLCTVQMFLFYQ